MGMPVVTAFDPKASILAGAGCRVGSLAKHYRRMGHTRDPIVCFELEGYYYGGRNKSGPRFTKSLYLASGVDSIALYSWAAVIPEI
jgi:hypothetical protein